MSVEEKSGADSERISKDYVRTRYLKAPWHTPKALNRFVFYHAILANCALENLMQDIAKTSLRWDGGANLHVLDFQQSIAWLDEAIEGISDFIHNIRPY